jgi:hypothetical protein
MGRRRSRAQSDQLCAPSHFRPSINHSPEIAVVATLKAQRSDITDGSIMQWYIVQQGIQQSLQRNKNRHAPLRFMLIILVLQYHPQSNMNRATLSSISPLHSTPPPHHPASAKSIIEMLHKSQRRTSPSRHDHVLSTH